MHDTKEDIGDKRLFKELLISTNDELRDSLNSMNSNGIQLDGVRMDEFVELQKNLIMQLEVSDDSKHDIAKMQESIDELKQTDDALNIKHANVVEHFQQEEERAGVAGFQDVNNQLQRTSSQTASLNELKSQAVADISAMVQKIAATLEGKKEELEPKVNMRSTSLLGSTFFSDIPFRFFSTLLD